MNKIIKIPKKHTERIKELFDETMAMDRAMEEFAKKARSRNKELWDCIIEITGIDVTEFVWRFDSVKMELYTVCELKPWEKNAMISNK